MIGPPPHQAQIARRLVVTGSGSSVRWSVVIGVGVSVPLLAFAVAIWWAEYGVLTAHRSIGLDYRVFVAYGERLLATGSLYLPSQLVGPYEWASLPGDPSIRAFEPAAIPTVYPPLIALLAIPAAVLPWFVWWFVPIAVLGHCVASWRPAAWSWPVLAALLAWPGTAAVVLVGGSGMWMMMAIAAGLRWKWPIVLVLIKPTLAPIVVIGLRNTRFWIALLVLALLSIPLLSDWLRYPLVLVNAWPPSAGDFTGNLPLMAVPVVAWLGSLWAPRRIDRAPMAVPTTS